MLVSKDAEAARAGTETHTQDKYRNPRACAPRVNIIFERDVSKGVYQEWLKLGIDGESGHAMVPVCTEVPMHLN